MPDYRMTHDGYRVFFDSNAGTQEGYWLWFEQSERDLNAIGHALKDGLEIVIYMPGELEMRANLRWGTGPFNSHTECWWAEPIPNTIRYLDGSG